MAENESPLTPGLAICGPAEAAKVLGLSKPIVEALARGGYIKAALCDGHLVLSSDSVNEFAAFADQNQRLGEKKQRRARKAKTEDKHV